MVGFLSIRLGDLYVALVTLTFGLLMENLIFTLPVFVNQGLGITLNRPTFASSNLAFTYLCLAVFVVISLFIVNFRRSTTGLALNAARWSENGARTSGISVVQMKVMAGALAAFIAAIGGGLLGLSQTNIQPSEFATFLGVIWLAVFVTIGVRSNAAALIGGMTGLGAVSAAKYPEGVLAENVRRVRQLALRLTPNSSNHGPSALAVTEQVK
jgi:branched-chain amino acid transport system permease protein